MPTSSHKRWVLQLRHGFIHERGLPFGRYQRKIAETRAFSVTFALVHPAFVHRTKLSMRLDPVVIRRRFSRSNSRLPTGAIRGSFFRWRRTCCSELFVASEVDAQALWFHLISKSSLDYLPLARIMLCRFHLLRFLSFSLRAERWCESDANIDVLQASLSSR